MPKASRWRKLVVFSLTGAALVWAAVLSPVLMHRIERMQRARQAEFAEKVALLTAREASGLAACQFQSDVDAHGLNRFLDQDLPGTPALSINILPTFDDMRGLRIIGDRLYRIHLSESDGFRLWDYLSPGASRQPQRTLLSAPLRHLTATRLTALFGSAIREAGGRLNYGKDGDTYTFNSGPGLCGKTWSPDPLTRAGRLVALVALLDRHAQLTARRDLVFSDLQIQRSATALMKD
ncbi:MAG: hypothetical protein AB7V26_11470 [Lysobacterales bacterium]